jgi:hypothetical protein
MTAPAVIFALLLQVETPPAPDSEAGWIQSSKEDRVWTLADSEGRGASLTVKCQAWFHADESVSIVTKESLLEMADKDDGEIVIVLTILGENVERLEGDGTLAFQGHGVRFEERASSRIIDRLRKTRNVGRAFTITLTNNDQREDYRFRNSTRVCEKPTR